MKKSKLRSSVTAVAFSFALILSMVFLDGQNTPAFGKNRAKTEYVSGAGCFNAFPASFVSPLVLDLNNNKRTSESIFEANNHFDLDGDGFKEKSGWVEAEDGLLAMDRDQNGTIDSGGELFGNYTQDETGKYFDNGFAALAALDDNRDGKIDARDEQFGDLRIWQDANADGISQADELKTLDEHNIQEISLNVMKVNGEEGRNKVSHEAFFIQRQTDEDGNVLTNGEGIPFIEEKAVRDIWFMRDNQDTVYDFDGELFPDILSLPEMKGSGRVITLSYAMAKDSALKHKVADFLAVAGTEGFCALYSRAEEILARWTRTDDIDPEKSRGVQNILNHDYDNPKVIGVFRVYAKARAVAILERFAGEAFRMKVDGAWTNDVMGTAMARSMADKYEYLTDTVVITLLGQSLFGKAVYDPEIGKMDRAELFFALENVLVNGADSGRKQKTANLMAALLDRDHLSVFRHVDRSVLAIKAVQRLLTKNKIFLTVDTQGKVVGRFGDKQYLGDGDDTVSGSGEIHGRGGNDRISGGSGDDVIFGGDGNDTIFGGDGNDMLFGGNGDDVLITGKSPDDFGYGHDILEGGMGNDVYTGSRRSSTYVCGYGNDIIKDLGQVGNSPDVLDISGISSDEFRMERDGPDLKIVFRDLYLADDDHSNGSVLIKDAFGTGKIELFKFHDQTLDLDRVLAIGQWSSGWFPKQEEAGRP